MTDKPMKMIDGVECYWAETLGKYVTIPDRDLRYPLLQTNEYGIRKYGPWSISVPVDPPEPQEWCWWREDADGNHLPGSGIESSLDACVQQIDAFEDAA